MGDIKQPIHNYSSFLPKGKENAIPSAALAKMLRFNSIRALQKDIETARNAGELILSSTSGGYYLPSSALEVKEFICTLEHRAKGIFRTLKHARQYMRRLEGQMTFSEGSDGQFEFSTEEFKT